MGVFFTEADYENSVIELFKNMGYIHIYGPDIERDFESPLYDIIFYLFFVKMEYQNKGLVMLVVILKNQLHFY